MSNANRDYAIIYDVKNSSLVSSRPLNFYITDRNTSNIFVRLVTKVDIGDGIDQYTDIEEASSYVLTMRVIKPNNEVKSIEATQHESGSVFQFDLTEDFKDIPGKYICELTISTIVSERQELITSDPFNYEVKRSILSNVSEIIETEDITTEKLLNNIEASKIRLFNDLELAKTNLHNDLNATSSALNSQVQANDNKIENIKEKLSSRLDVTEAELSSQIKNVKNNINNINNIFKNVEEEEGSTIKGKIDLCISKGYTKLIFPTTTSIDDLIINSSYVHYKFNKDITIGGKGIIIAGNGNVLEFNSILGDVRTIENGKLTPTSTKEYAICTRGAFNKVIFNKIEGFTNGLLFEDGSNGTENNFEGLIQKCDNAVNLINTTGSARHEGNTFNLRIFQCNKGYNIGSNCKYQNINKVVDNAEINNSYDIIDNAGSHILNLYFFRYGNSIFNGKVISHNVNGSPFYEVGSNANKTRIGTGNIDLVGSTAFIDFSDSDNKDYDYRIFTSTSETGEECLRLVSSGSYVLDILKKGYAAFPNRYEGEYGTNWENFITPEVTSPGAIVFAYNTMTGKARLYVRIASGWRYFEQTGTVV